MKALWAFEPFHQETTRIRLMDQLLQQLTGSRQRMELAFVITRAEPGMNLAFDVPREQRYTTFPKQMTKLALKKAGVELPDRNIHMIDFETLSTTKTVDRFLKLAKARKTDLIGIYTHARRGFTRSVLGSFAETAIHRSRQNLLVVNPLAKIDGKLRNILYATDFSSPSEKHLKFLLPLCRRLKAQLTVFHHHEAIYRWSLNEAEREIKALRSRTEKKRLEIESACRRAGVRHKFVFSEAFKATSDLILSLITKEKPDLVAVTAKSGPTVALLGGSVTRKIVRSSPVPILVLK